MKGYLGVNDSCIQATEVAIRHLIDSSLESNDSLQQFIHALSEKYSLSHGIHDFEELKSTIAKSYIVQTYNVVEHFFRDLIHQYVIHRPHETWITQKEGKNIDLFNQLIENFSKHQRSIIDLPEQRLLNYYRLVRNAIVHNTEKSKNSAVRFYKDVILTDITYFNRYTSKAPNAPFEISYDDFIIYTRALKYFSIMLNEACSIKAAEILQVASTSRFYKGIKNDYTKSNPSTIQSVIKSSQQYYRHNYGNGKVELPDFITQTLTSLGISESIYKNYI